MHQPPKIKNGHSYAIKDGNYFFDASRDDTDFFHLGEIIIKALKERGYFYFKNPEWAMVEEVKKETQAFESYHDKNTLDEYYKGAVVIGNGAVNFDSVEQESEKFIDLKHCFNRIHSQENVQKKTRQFIICKHEWIKRWHFLTLNLINKSILQGQNPVASDLVLTTSNARSYSPSERQGDKNLIVHDDLGFLSFIYREKPGLWLKECPDLDFKNLPGDYLERMEAFQDCGKDTLLKLYRGYSIVIPGTDLYMWMINHNMDPILPTYHFVKHKGYSDSMVIFNGYLRSVVLRAKFQEKTEKIMKEKGIVDKTVRGVNGFSLSFPELVKKPLLSSHPLVDFDHDDD